MKDKATIYHLFPQNNCSQPLAIQLSVLKHIELFKFSCTMLIMWKREGWAFMKKRAKRKGLARTFFTKCKNCDYIVTKKVQKKEINFRSCWIVNVYVTEFFRFKFKWEVHFIWSCCIGNNKYFKNPWKTSDMSSPKTSVLKCS